jgi:Flp pilus assembly protein TadB
MGFNLKSLLFFLAFLTAATAVMLLAPRMLGRALTGAEVAAIALTVAVVLARLSLLARRRQRQKVEEMRDSALW